MSGEDEDDRLAGLYESSMTQLLEPCEGNGGGGFAADAALSNDGFGVGDLLFGDALDRAVGGLDFELGFGPGDGVSDADGGG